MSEAVATGSDERPLEKGPIFWFTDITNEIRFNLAIFFLPLFCGLCLVALIFVSRYKIDRAGHVANLEALATRHQTDITDSGGVPAS
ncbi:MAG: hypothetical protein O7E57_04000 [Gammaproteobacteria bacterium]|nr:hypothetical protein [Gammaproteobacteria bacterium]